MNKSNIAREYRQKYPDMPSLKLARIIYNDHNLTFPSVEAVRSHLRYIEGKQGTNQRKKIKFEDIMTEARPYNPYKLPPSDEQPYLPKIISGFQRIGILSDVHFPYHNIGAMTVALDGLKKVLKKGDAILLNGDIIDCHRLSRFMKDPKKRNFKQEVDMLKGFFDNLQSIFDCQIIYKLGNHEDRYQRFLYEKASEIAGIEDFEFNNIIKAREKGIMMVESHEYMKINDLIGIHGHEFPGSGAGDMIAKSLYQKGNVNAFQGHNHRTDTYVRRNPFDGSIVCTYSIGCLSELHPAYSVLQKNPWNYGYAWVELDNTSHQFHNEPIYDNQIRDLNQVEKSTSKRSNSSNRKHRQTAKAGK